MDLLTQKLRFCEAVRKRRLALGISLSELAEQSGMSVGYLRRIERGDLPPRLMVSHAAGLARALGCQIHELF